MPEIKPKFISILNFSHSIGMPPCIVALQQSKFDTFYAKIVFKAFKKV